MVAVGASAAVRTMGRAREKPATPCTWAQTAAGHKRIPAIANPRIMIPPPGGSCLLGQSASERDACQKNRLSVSASAGKAGFTTGPLRVALRRPGGKYKQESAAGGIIALYPHGRWPCQGHQPDLTPPFPYASVCFAQGRYR